MVDAHRPKSIPSGHLLHPYRRALPMLAHPVCKVSMCADMPGPYACARTACQKRDSKTTTHCFSGLPPSAVKTVCKAITSSLSFRDILLMSFCSTWMQRISKVCSGAAVDYETLIKHPLEVLWKHLWFWVIDLLMLVRYISGQS